MLLYCCLFLIFSCSDWMKNTSGGIMDDCEFSSPEVSVKTTKKKRVNKKIPNPRFYKRLIQCLDEGEYSNMLSYVPGSSRNEFEVTFTDRKNKKEWKEDDIALFVELDKYIENIFKRKRSTKKYEEAVKVRFKSNMCKCVRFKFIKKMDEKKIGKSKTVKKYKILWLPSASDGESSDNDKKSKGKSCRREKKKIDNKKICKNETVNSTLCTTANCGKNQNVESRSTKECKGLKGCHEIAHPASMIQENNNQMHSENIYRENNCDFLCFCEDDKRDTLQFNPLANYQIDEKKICKNENVCLTLCTSKNCEKNQNVESHSTKECKGLKGCHEIAHLASMFQGNYNKMHSENVYQENNCDFLNFCEDDSGNVFQCNLEANYQMEMDRNEHVDSTFENLDNLGLVDNMEMDENVHMDFKVDLENSKISCPSLGIEKVYGDDFNVFDPSMYLSESNSKIENTSCKVAFENTSSQYVLITNTFLENSHYYTNSNDQMMQEILYTFFRNSDANTKLEYDRSLCQGNKFLENQKVVLKSDPFLCSVPKGCQKISNSLGDFDDWTGSYQELEPMELNEEWNQLSETRN